MSDLAEIEARYQQQSVATVAPGYVSRDLDWLIAEVKRLQRFEVMWEDCRQHRDHAEAHARHYMRLLQQVAAIVAPDEGGAL